MGLFGKKDNDNSDLNAFLGVGTEYRGKLDFVGMVRIDGCFEGEISTDGDLILGRKASVTGNIRVGRLTSCGRIEGTVEVKGRTLLDKTSVLHGTLKTASLVMEDGALFEGEITMSQEGTVVSAKVVSANFGGENAQDGIVETAIAKTGSDDTTR